MIQILRGIRYLHSKTPKIIHRDLKPENILINSNNEVKIADFGWSNVEKGYRNTLCGTPQYIAPEVLMETGHNHKADVWSCGVLLYELLHKKPPYKNIGS